MTTYPQDRQDHDKQRHLMVEVQLQKRGIRDRRLLAAMREVPRHSFVPGSLAGLAYTERPLPIGFGQTVSQPYIVARMIEALELKGNERVLDVGTGCGYQAAVLGRLAREIHSVEIVPGLFSSAGTRLARLGADNVEVHLGDGSVGWKPAAPYHAIIVAAGTPAVPGSLIEQLADGGRLVVPVGDQAQQSLRRVTRRGSRIDSEDLEFCQFVPLIGEEGFRGSFRFAAEMP